MTDRNTTPTTGRQHAVGRSSAVRLSGSQPTGSTRTLEVLRDDLDRPIGKVARTVLPSGLRILTEQMPGIRSASVGVYVGVGSRHETPTLHGCSHFLEHVLFKGTRRRSAMDISAELDAVGGDFNAYTSKEYTCFHARVLDEDLPTTLDVLGDMLTGSLIRPEDVDAEREVILDEIAMHDDDPEDVAFNLLSLHAWGDSPLGRPIAGSVDSIEAMTTQQVRRFHRRHYRPERMVVSVAGNIDHDQVVADIERTFAGNGFLDGTADPVAAALTDRARPVRPGEVRLARPSEQVQVLLGVRGLTRSDVRQPALGVLTTGLGGGTSSRLFQEVRERRGLTYSVYSFGMNHTDAGMVGVGAGCLPGKVDAVLETVDGELRRLVRDGLDADEIARAKGQLRGGVVLGLEDSMARMHRLGKSELVHDELVPIDEVLRRIEVVSEQDVADLAVEVFGRSRLVTLVGPLA